MCKIFSYATLIGVRGTCDLDCLDKGMNNQNSNFQNSTWVAICICVLYNVLFLIKCQSCIQNATECIRFDKPYKAVVLQSQECGGGTHFSVKHKVVWFANSSEIESITRPQTLKIQYLSVLIACIAIPLSTFIATQIIMLLMRICLKYYKGK